MKRPPRIFITTLYLFALCGCEISAPGSRPWLLYETIEPTAEELPAAISELLTSNRQAGAPYYTPTPDSPHTLPTVRSDALEYTVQSGDYLSLIASNYSLTLDALLLANPQITSDVLEPGQILAIPLPQNANVSSDFKIIPDSELVYGPYSSTLDIDEFVSQFDGYLNSYVENPEGENLTGSQVVKLVASEYSVNPRLLLALLEYKSGWVTQSQIDSTTAAYPMGKIDQNYQGLYQQLAWTANNLNYAYYLWKRNGLASVLLADGTLSIFPATINAGTAAVQYLLGKLNTSANFSNAISSEGLYATYVNFFGIPFDYSIDPLIPADLTQPEMILPFESGVEWYFTSGPHGGWGSGSAWAALDFGPRGETSYCQSSNEWVLAVADGVILRAKNGAVVEDLDNDGLEQTGWTLLYMHIESRDRVKAGTYVKAGDRIGHPSCEGGYSNGTHTHIARRYNGEWIAADGSLPFIMSGWQSAGSGVEYDGTLTLDGQVVISWDGPIDENKITR